MFKKPYFAQKNETAERSELYLEVSAVYVALLLIACYYVESFELILQVTANNEYLQ